MDIKAKIEEVVKKVTSDKDLADKFQKDPAKTIEELIGMDIPEEQVNQVVGMVKAKITADNVGGIIGGLMGKKKD